MGDSTRIDLHMSLCALLRKYGSRDARGTCTALGRAMCDSEHGLAEPNTSTNMTSQVQSRPTSRHLSHAYVQQSVEVAIMANCIEESKYSACQQLSQRTWTDCRPASPSNIAHLDFRHAWKLLYYCAHTTLDRSNATRRLLQLLQSARYQSISANITFSATFTWCSDCGSPFLNPRHASSHQRT
jgi:hypothetical protein